MYWTKAMCRRLVMTFRAKGKPFTFQEMYEKGPGDLDLYAVVSDLVKAGLINGPDPLDPCIEGDHGDWTYNGKEVEAFFLAWTTAPVDYDYWYVERTGEVKHQDGTNWFQVKVTDQQRWDNYQVYRYDSGHHCTHTEAEQALKAGVEPADDKQ